MGTEVTTIPEVAPYGSIFITCLLPTSGTPTLLTLKNIPKSFFRRVNKYAEKERLMEYLKGANQVAWVQGMDNIRTRVTEVIDAEIIFM